MPEQALKEMGRVVRRAGPGRRSAGTGSPQLKTQHPREESAGARLDDVTSGSGRASGCGQGRRLVQPEEGERMKRPARSAPLCVAGLPGAAERERVPEQHPRVPARLRGVPASGGG